MAGSRRVLVGAGLATHLKTHLKTRIVDCQSCCPIFGKGERCHSVWLLPVHAEKGERCHSVWLLAVHAEKGGTRDIRPIYLTPYKPYGGHDPSQGVLHLPCMPPCPCLWGTGAGRRTCLKRAQGVLGQHMQHHTNQRGARFKSRCASLAVEARRSRLRRTACAATLTTAAVHAALVGAAQGCGRVGGGVE